MLRDELKTRLIESAGFEEPGDLPPYLQGREYRWVPTFVLRHTQSGLTVGFELAYAADLPVEVLKEARRAQEEHADFAAVVLTSLTSARDELCQYCRAEGFGLAVFAPGLIRFLVPPRFVQTPPVHLIKITGEGWLPSALCGQIGRLDHIRANHLILQSIPALNSSRTGPGEAADVVKGVLNGVIEAQRQRFAAALPFYRLEGLENLLFLTGSSRSEHIIHSFRVYVAGCVIINHFWDFFVRTWNHNIGIGGVGIDDVWFLTSMFHDCGYFRHPELRKEAALALELPSEEADLTAAAATALNRDEYRRALQAVGSFLAHLRRRRGHWDFGAVGGSLDQQMQDHLARWYRTLGFHSVVSGIDLASEMVRAVHRASAKRTNDLIDRAFLAGHVFPAAAAITMHDWRLWPDLRKSHLFPFRASYYPLAGLLMYLDTLDDYRRRKDTAMTVSDMELGADFVQMHVRWRDPAALARAKAGYEDYAQSVRWSAEMRLGIVVDEAAQ